MTTAPPTPAPPSPASRRVRLVDDAGIEWSVLPETGHGIRITPRPMRGFAKATMIRQFPPLPGPAAQAAPQAADTLFGFLLAMRPRTVEATAELLAKDFPTTPVTVREDAIRRYAEGFLSVPRRATSPLPL